jgi:hypothetical protein
MLNFVFNLWVKIVNNLRKHDRTTSGNSSPINQHNQFKNIIQWVKLIVIGPSLPQLSTTKNTPETLKINLIDKSFTHFPQDLLINLKNEN